MGSLSSFEELDCWKEAASRSVTANIAEGFGRFHHRENPQFCRVSRGSLTEVIDHLIVAYEEAYITNEELNDLKQQPNKCITILNGYINYLQRAKAISKDKS